MVLFFFVMLDNIHGLFTLYYYRLMLFGLNTFDGFKLENGIYFLTNRNLDINFFILFHYNTKLKHFNIKTPSEENDFQFLEATNWFQFFVIVWGFGVLAVSCRGNVDVGFFGDHFLECLSCCNDCFFCSFIFGE